MKNLLSGLAALLVFCVSCGEENSSRGNKGESSLEGKIRLIERDRAEADREVFFNEKEAQRHEAVFVRLWDAMRKGEPYAALSMFPFERMSIARSKQTIPLSFGPYPIEHVVFTGQMETVCFSANPRAVFAKLRLPIRWQGRDGHGGVPLRISTTMATSTFLSPMGI